MSNTVHDKSPPKVKTKEEFHWTAGWWDYYPLVEQLSPRRVEWSNSSIIFSPHASQPRVLARHFSSSKHFSIPTPTPILASPDAYDPPTVISASSDDIWLFAYFPGRGSDGSACLWRRGAEIDRWAIHEFWGLAPGAGIVAASWLGSARDWSTNENGTFVHLPPRGPITPVSSPTLFLVTQDHRATLCYLRHFIPTLKMISISLTQADATTEQQSRSVPEPDNISALKLCSSAAIGLGYNESSILVATRSHVLPYPASNTSADNFNAMDITVPLEFDQQNQEYAPPMDEPCGEDTVIELTQVSLTFNGVSMHLSSKPLEPLGTSDARIADMQFICRPAIDKSTKPTTHLLVSSLQFGDFSSTPKSSLFSYSFSQATGDGASGWKNDGVTSRTFQNEVVGFMTPSRPFTRDRHGCVYVGLLSTSGSFSLRSQKEKEVQIGSTKLLRLPELSDDENFETSSIFTSSTKAGREFPIYATVSPNEVLLCSLSSNLYVSQVSVHALPKPVSDTVTRNLSTSIASALLSRRSTSDFVHVLSLPSMSLDDVADIMYHTFKVIEDQPTGRPGLLTSHALGVVLEVYRNRAKSDKDPALKDILTARWQSAHDMCSLVACNAAFEDCKDNDGPDLNAVWQFAGICSWIIAFVEKVMKEVMLRNNNASSKVESDLFGEDPEAPPPEQDSPYLLHVVHPYTLKSLKDALSNVRKLRNRLDTLKAQGENSTIAKGVVVDMVNCATVNLDELEPLLDGFITESQSISAEDGLKSLAACEPTPSMLEQLDKNVLKLCESGVISKSRLYIRPEELIDGFESLTLDKNQDGKEKDVVSKGMLLRRRAYVQCLRCDGQSEVAMPAAVSGQTTPSLRWRAWEKLWVPVCICGGPWIKGVVSQM